MTKQNCVLTCTHPPTRLFTWFAVGATDDGTLCIACCDCGEVLAGAAEDWAPPSPEATETDN